MARRKKKPQDPKWITEARKALDEMETWDSDDPHIAARIAPFRTQNWIRKGWGMLAGLKPIACLVLVALVAGCLGREDPGGRARFDRFQILNEIRWIRENHIGDPLGPVHEARPDIYHGFFGGGH